MRHSIRIVDRRRRRSYASAFVTGYIIAEIIFLPLTLLLFFLRLPNGHRHRHF